MTIEALPPGIIDLHKAIELNPNTRLTGAADGSTWIRWHGTFDAWEDPGVAVVPADNCIIENLGIECVNVPHLAGCIGCREQDGDPPHENVLVQDCRLVGLSDCIYHRHTTRCSMSIVDCELSTKWDLIMPAGALHKIDVQNCRLKADGFGYVFGGSEQECNLTTVLGGEVSLHNCYGTAVGPLNTRGLWTVGAGWPGFVAGSRIDAHDCFISAKTLVLEADDTTINHVGCSYPAEIELKIDRMHHEDGVPMVKLSWWGYEGVVFWLEVSDDWGPWQSAVALDGIADRMELIETVDPTRSRFYRLRIVPQQS